MIPIIATLLAVCAALLAPTRAHAQDGNDSTWDDYGANPEGFTLGEEVFGHVSAGWFPQAYFGQTLSYAGTTFFDDVYDHATNLRSPSLVPTTAPFSGEKPLTSNERKILKPNSADEEDDGYPGTDYSEYTLQYLLNLPMPAVLRGSAGLQVTEGLLFSNDRSRSYLTIGGAKQNFQEVGTLHLKEYSLAASADLLIPVYGGFIKNESMRFASYYYIFGGITGSYAVSSKATQYTQIADAKDQIRYGNGTDTVTLINDETLASLNRFRTHYDAGIGWNLAFESIAFGFEAFVMIPHTSILPNTDWKQYIAGLRVSLGWHWVPEK